MKNAKEDDDTMKPTEEHTGDPHLGGCVGKYAEWLLEGAVRNTSKVIPVRTSLGGVQWILPSEQTISYLRRARKIALTDCACRVHYGRCAGPIRVCLLFDDAAEKAVAMDGARFVLAEEAEEVIQVADQVGLVHMTLHAPQERVFAVCNCCRCCCHDPQLLLRYGRTDLTVRSDDVAATIVEACVDCGRCVGRCTFGARRIEDGRLVYNETACYGCGLCVSVCPTGATSMNPRRDVAVLPDGATSAHRA